jgi:hypothetical protein
MLQITTPPTPSSRPAGADASGEPRAPGDGFADLLAGLMGIAVPPVVAVEPLRPVTLDPPPAGALDPAPAVAPEAAAEPGDAMAEGAAPGHGMGRRLGEITDGAAPDAGLRKLPLPAGGEAIAKGGAGAPADAAVKAELPGSNGQPQATAAAAPAGDERQKAGQQANQAAGTPSVPLSTDDSRVGRPQPNAQDAAALAIAARQAPEATRRPAGERPPALVEAMRQATERPDAGTAVRRLPEAATAQPGTTERPVGPAVTLLARQAALPPFALETEWRPADDGLALRGLTSMAAGTSVGLEASTSLAEPAGAAATPAIRQMAMAIERAVGGELRNLTVQLTPEALGTIEIAFELDAERRLSVTILFERPETLELLRHESRDLQRQLAQQGIDLADGGLELGLMGGERRDRRASEQHAAPTDSDGESGPGGPAAQSSPGAASTASAQIGLTGRLNLSI